MREYEIVLFVSGNTELDLAAATEVAKLTNYTYAYMPGSEILGQWYRMPFIDTPIGRIHTLDGIRDFVSRETRAIRIQ